MVAVSGLASGFCRVFRYSPLCYCVGVVVHKSCGDTDGVLPDVCGAKGGCRACVKIVIPWCGNL